MKLVVVCNTSGVSLSMLCLSELPDPVMTIFGEHQYPILAGEILQLTCNVTVVEHLTAEPKVQWKVGNGDSYNVSISNTTRNGVTSLRNLTFSHLQTSLGGQYLCQANINISSIHLLKTANLTHEVIVKSKQLIMHYHCVNEFTNFPLFSPQSKGDDFWSDQWF